MTAVQTEPQFDLAQLVRDHQADVWRYLRFLGADRIEVDDLVQETFLEVARRPFEVRGTSQSGAYLRRVARNRLLMARRQSGRQLDTVELAAAEQVWADWAGEGMSDYMLALDDCLDQLQGRARQVVELFYRENLGRAEIAQRMQMQPDGVKTLLRRTRQLLRGCVEKRVQS